MRSPTPLPADFADAFAQVSLGRLTGPYLHFEEIGSTNDVATALAAQSAEGGVVLADMQTTGRGRRGHVWFSPPAAGLYVSVVLAPQRAVRQPERATALVTLAAGVALAEAIQQATGLQPAIKWPNDLLVGPRKLAGILAEGVPHHTASGLRSVVLGFGINVLSSAYPPDLNGRVTSLESELGRAVDRAQVCAQALAALARRYDDLLDARYDAILDGWRARAPRATGAKVRFERGTVAASGVTAGIDGEGALLVRTATGLERIVSGEVVWD